jgi:hypothetical protein
VTSFINLEGTGFLSVIFGRLVHAGYLVGENNFVTLISGQIRPGYILNRLNFKNDLTQILMEKQSLRKKAIE